MVSAGASGLGRIRGLTFLWGRVNLLDKALCQHIHEPARVTCLQVIVRAMRDRYAGVQDNGRGRGTRAAEEEGRELLRCTTCSNGGGVLIRGTTATNLSGAHVPISCA